MCIEDRSIQDIWVTPSGNSLAVIGMLLDVSFREKWEPVIRPESAQNNNLGHIR